MSKLFHFSTGPRCFWLFSFALLSLFAGCGKMRSWYADAQTQSGNPHSVTIGWAASKSTVAGYNVYRVSRSGDTVKVSKGIVTETRYTDRTVEPGQTYSYYVKSIDFRGIESGPSDKVTVTIPTTVSPSSNQ
jgi:fibronectin type 3 domain-containing protein